MKLSDKQIAAMSDHGIPNHMHGGLIRYYENGIEPGSFLAAVINNDLREACGTADDINRHRLFNYMMWFYNEAPSGTWGYSGAVNDWTKRVKTELETVND